MNKMSLVFLMQFELRKLKIRTLLWFLSTEKSSVVSRDTRAPFRYNVTKNNQ